MSEDNPSSFGEVGKVPQEATGSFNARRFTAASLALQGLLSGNGLLRLPSDEMVYAYATDAVRLADALLDVLDNPVVAAREPEEVGDTIYPEDAKMLQQVETFNEQERLARGKQLIGRVDTSGCGAPVPEEIIR